MNFLIEHLKTFKPVIKTDDSHRTGTHWVPVYFPNDHMATDEEQDKPANLPPHLLIPPHDNWEFNLLLYKLAKNITDEELKDLKYFESGQDGIRKKLFEEIKTPQEFFQYLQERNILTADNLVHLQAMLWHLDRKDLVRECAMYAETAGNTLYFHQPSPKPVNGYRHAAFHVEGKDLRKYKREDLDKLRDILNRRLGVPHEYIIISGLTPSNSLVIMVMIPEYNTEILVELLNENRLTELSELGIDSVLINDQTFIITEKSKVFRFEERHETLELLEKLERSQSLQEQCSIELLRLRKKLKANEERLYVSQITERKLKKVTDDVSELLRMQEETFKNWHMQGNTLQTQSALAYFRFAMNTVKASGHDTDEVMELLEANTYFISSKTKDTCRQAFRILYNNVEELKLLWATQMFETLMSRLASRKNKQHNVPESELHLRSKHGLPTGLSTGLDNLLLMSLSQLHAANKERSEWLRRYSMELSEKDIAQLRVCLPYDWTSDENSLVESDHGEFLGLVLNKELKKRGADSVVIIPSFIPPLLEKIGRKDLAEKFLDEARLKEKDTIIEIGMRTSRGELQEVSSLGKSTREEDESKESDEIKKSLERIEKMVAELYEKRNLPDSHKKLFESILLPRARYRDFTSTLILP